MQSSHEELQIKLSRIHSLLDRHKVEGVLLRRVSNFFWGTCGATCCVNAAATEGAASLLITPEYRYLITNNIEAPRLEQETGLTEQGWEFIVSPWTDPQKGLIKLVTGMTIAADVAYPGAIDVSMDVARLRSTLTDTERERFRQLGRLCAAALVSALQAVQPGMRENQIAALVSSETGQRGVQPIVNLVATDERVYRFRHPLPTEKKLEKYAMLVLCGRKWGLVCSLTRLIHFGPLPVDLQEKILATAQANAALISLTRPGRSLGELFLRGQQTYASLGHPDEWLRHHQGGVTGYEPREFLALPDSREIVLEGQAFAWNPSITGAKTEDTILILRSGNEVITLTPSLPLTMINNIPCSLALKIE